MSIKKKTIEIEKTICKPFVVFITGIWFINSCKKISSVAKEIILSLKKQAGRRNGLSI